MKMIWLINFTIKKEINIAIINKNKTIIVTKINKTDSK